MHEPPDEPLVVTPQRRARNLRFLVAAVGFAYVVYSGFMFTSQRNLIASQERIAREQFERAAPVLDDVRPLTERLDPAAIAREAGQLRALVRETRPLVRELRPVARETLPLVRELRSVDAHRALAAAGEAGAQAAEGRRLARSLDLTIETLDEVRRRDLVRRLAVMGERVERLVGVQEEALVVLRRSLAVQQETLQRIRNIDRRTGGVDPLAPSGSTAP
jgi:hypothetical protein